MTTIQAKDLTKEFPRSPYEEIDGLPWLLRMIDKVRALNAGKIGEYTPFPCGGDQGFMGALGLDADAVKAKISSGASDAEVVAWVKTQLPADAEQRLAGYKQFITSPLSGEMKTYFDADLAELRAARPDLDLSRVDNWARLICAEEGYAY